VDYLDNVQSLGFFNEKGLAQEQSEIEVDPVLGVNINNIQHHYVNPSVLVKPLINMYHGVKNNSLYRQMLSDPKKLKKESLSTVIKEAIELMENKTKDMSDK
jgi:hypothetical protein